MKGEPSRGLLYGAVLLMVLLWSGNYLAAKVALRELNPVLLTCLRISFAGLMILPLYLREPRRWTRTEAGGLFALGLLGVTLNQFFFVLGVAGTSVTHAGIVIALTPICVLVIAAAMGMERVTVYAAIGMALALAGVALLQLARGGDGGSRATLAGDGIVFLAAVTFATFTVLGKRMRERHSGVTVNTFAYVGGAMVLLPVTLWQLAHHDVSRVSLGGWCAVVYMALFPSVVAYLIYYWALGYIKASKLAAFSYLQPPLVTLMAALVLGETVTMGLVLPGLLILAGVVLTERTRWVAAVAE